MLKKQERKQSTAEGLALSKLGFRPHPESGFLINHLPNGPSATKFIREKAYKNHGVFQSFS